MEKQQVYCRFIQENGTVYNKDIFWLNENVIFRKRVYKEKNIEEVKL